MDQCLIIMQSLLALPSILFSADDFRRQCSLSTSGPHLKTDNYMLPMDLKVESSDQGVVGQMLNNNAAAGM